MHARPARPEVKAVPPVGQSQVDALDRSPALGQVADGQRSVLGLPGGEHGDPGIHRPARHALGDGDVEGDFRAGDRVPEPPAAVFQRLGGAGEVLDPPIRRPAFLAEDDGAFLPGVR